MTEQRFDPLNLAKAEWDRQDRKLREDENSREDEEHIVWLMSSTKGRRFLWRLLARAGVFHSSFNTNAMTMAFNEGRRNQGLELLNRINTFAPDQYMTMVKENTNVKRNDKDGRRKHQ